MFYTKLIFYFYLFLTILSIISPVKFDFIAFLPGILLMWIYYAVFKRGSKTMYISTNINVINLSKQYNFSLIIITLLFLLFYPIYMEFYTGLNPKIVISSLNEGISTYSLYQKNFEDSALSSFSIKKLPFILGNGILRFLLIVSFLKIIIFRKKVFRHEYACFSLMFFIVFFVGLGRGTSFELFEIATIIIFTLAAKRSYFGHKTIFTKSTLIKLFVFIILGVSFFSYNLMVRYGDAIDFFTFENFDKSSVIYSISKPLALVLYNFYGYFLFGLHFTSVVISELFLGSFNGFVSMFIPNGASLLGIAESEGFLSQYQVVVSRFININAMWRPDAAHSIELYGIFITFLIIFIFGHYSKIFYKKGEKHLSALVLLYFIFYFFISLPIGGFIYVSSGNQLCIFIALICYKLNLFPKTLKL